MKKSDQLTRRVTKMEQFSACFKNEADLRHALIALLERLPNTSRVRHTHGATEKGKDIVFTSGGAFASEETVACVVKNAPITGSAQSDEGARTVYNQAEQCLDTPFLNSEGREEFASRAFIITPYECSQSAIESIRGKLSKPEGVVKFLYGRKLYELFEKYYPEYLVFRSGLFGSYITDLENGISRDSTVANLLIKHGLSVGNTDILRIYVQPTLGITISKQFLMTEWPELASLLQPSCEADVESFVHRVEAFARFLAVIAPGQTSNEFADQVSGLVSDLRDLWNSAFANSRNTRSSVEMSERAERKRISLQLPGLFDLAATFRARTTTAKAAFEGFLKRLNQANELAESRPLTLVEFFSHPHRHDYSYITSITAQIPSLFEQSVSVSTVLRTSSQALIASDQDVLLTAPAGFGKSSFCRWNVLNDLRALKKGTSNVVPVLIPLHKFDGDLASNGSALFENSASLKELWSTRRSTDGSILNRRFRLYLDGLDEVPDAIRQRGLCGLAQDLKLQDSLTQLIFTGREHVGGYHLAGLSRMHVAEMSDKQIDELVSKWFNDQQLQIAQFRKQLSLIPSMTLIMRVPLLATLVLSVFESTSTLPESKIKLYDIFISLMAGGWDAAKRIQRGSEFGCQPKTTILQYLAGRLHVGERREASELDFRNAVKVQLPALEKKCGRLLEEIVQDGLLVPVGSSYEFSHLSFQEYLAAKDLIEPKGVRATNALVRYLRGNQWWNEVLFFYVALLGQPKELEAFIRKEAVRCARTYFEPEMLKRTKFLLTQLQRAYPGAQVDLSFSQWPKGADS